MQIKHKIYYRIQLWKLNKKFHIYTKLTQHRHFLCQEYTKTFSMSRMHKNTHLLVCRLDEYLASQVYGNYTDYPEPASHIYHWTQTQREHNSWTVHKASVHTLKLNTGTFYVRKAPCSQLWPKLSFWKRKSLIQHLRSTQWLTSMTKLIPCPQESFKVGAEMSTTSNTLSLNCSRDSCLEWLGMRPLSLISISQPRA